MNSVLAIYHTFQAYNITKHIGSQGTSKTLTELQIWPIICATAVRYGAHLTRASRTCWCKRKHYGAQQWTTVQYFDNVNRGLWFRHFILPLSKWTTQIKWETQSQLPSEICIRSRQNYDEIVIDMNSIHFFQFNAIYWQLYKTHVDVPSP